MDDQVVTLFGHAHVAIVTLHGDEFAVLGGADGVDECAQVDIVDVGVVDLDLAVMNTVLVDGRENLFRQFEGDIDAHGLALGVRADNADVQPAILGDGCRSPF